MSQERSKVSGAFSSGTVPDLEVDEKASDCDGAMTSSVPQCCGTESDRSSLTLDSNSEPPQKNLKPGYGLLGKVTNFGLRAKRTIQRCGGALDATVKKEDIIFLTGTLPGSTDAAFRCIAMFSSYLVDALKSWIAKRHKSTYSFYVWEWQKRGALHLHYAVHIPDRNIAEKLIHDFKEEWTRLLFNISQKSGVDVFEKKHGGSWKNYPSMVQTIAQRVNKSVSAYLAKYCGKDCNRKHPGFYAPVRWWGCSRPLLELLRSLTEEKVYTSLTFLGARNKLEKWYQCTLDISIKTYRYCHKVGTGETFVTYATSEDIETIWNEIMSMNYQYKPMTEGCLSTTALMDTAQKTCLQYYQRLLTQSRSECVEQTSFLGLQLRDLASGSMPEFQRISTLVACVATLKLKPLCRCMTWRENQQLQRIYVDLLTRLNGITALMEQNRISQEKTENTVDSGPELPYIRTKSPTSEGTVPEKAAATKDTIPQRAAFFDDNFDQLSFL